MLRPPGDIEDTLTRMIADSMRDETGVPASTVNIAVGGSLVGATHVFSQPADGYTVGVFAGNILSVHIMRDNAKYDRAGFESIAAIIGYGRKDLAQVAARQMEKLATFAFGFDYTNTPSIELAEKLVARAPANIAKVRFETGGGETDDHALQLARIYHAQKGAPRRRKILIHRDAYHGGTLAGMNLTGGRPGVPPNSADTIVLTPPRPYHTDLYDGRDLVGFCVDELRAVIAEHGADIIAAIFAELLPGPSGMIPLPDDYWPAMTAVLQEHGILFFADEVVTGFGRAGAWFMSSELGLAPDMIVLAKGMCSGYVPMAAVIMSEDVASTVNGLGPGNSYAGHAGGVGAYRCHRK